MKRTGSDLRPLDDQSQRHCLPIHPCLSGRPRRSLFKAFAAGALLTMLTDDLIPEARELAGLGAGLAAELGFAVAFALHQEGA